MSNDLFASLTQAVAERAKRAEVFEAVDCQDKVLACKARDVESEAFYKVSLEGSDGSGEPGEPGVWVGLYTADRWLSESIEADLLHSGDKMEDLLEEELVELGHDEGGLGIEHFRDDAKVYVFRSKLQPKPGETIADPGMIDLTLKVLLAYEACFRQLGDMSETDELV